MFKIRFEGVVVFGKDKIWDMKLWVWWGENKLILEN